MALNNIGICSCGDGSSINNYGTPGCLVGLEVPEDIYFIQQTKADGSVNGIDTTTDTLNQAFFDGKFKDETVSDRWLPLKDIIDFQAPPADPNTQDFPDGRIVKLSEGIGTVTFTILTDDPYKLKAKLDTMGCRNMSVMYKDRNGSLVGQTRGDNFIGREIQDNSLVVRVFAKTDAEANRVEVTFNYDRKADDGSVDFIPEDQLGGYSLDDVVELQDVNITMGAATTASLTFSLGVDWGGVNDRIPAEGLTTSELEVYNVTDDVVETLTSLTETSAGTYVAVYSVAVTVSDVMEVRGLSENYVQLSYDLKRLKGVTATTV